MKGWVGGAMTPEQWCEAAHSDALIHCHTTDFKHQCAGAAIFRANVMKSPRDRSALCLPADTVNVFAWDDEMIKHHRRGGKELTSAEIGKM